MFGVLGVYDRCMNRTGGEISGGFNGREEIGKGERGKEERHFLGYEHSVRNREAHFPRV